MSSSDPTTSTADQGQATATSSPGAIRAVATGSSSYALWTLGLLLALRAFLVLCLGDVFFYGEELEKGAAAKAMLDGLGIEHHRLAYHYYEGGGFVISHLNSLAFRILGPNLLAIKCVALLWLALIHLAGVRLLTRHVSARAGLWFGLLFALCSPAFQQISLLNLGIHFQALLFVILALDALLSLLALGSERVDSPPDSANLPRAAFFQLGASLGFGIYFSYQLAPVAAFCALCLVVRWRGRVFAHMRGWALAGLAFLVGFSPWIWMWSRVKSELFDIHGSTLTETGASAALANLKAFAGSLLTPSWSLAGVLPFALASVVALLQAARTDFGGRVGAMRLLLFFALFEALVYFGSGFAVGGFEHYSSLHRTSLLWFALLMLVSVWVGLASDRARVSLDSGLASAQLRANFALLIGVALVITGFAGTLRIAQAGHAHDFLGNLQVLRQHPGYRYPQYLAKIRGHIEADDLACLEVFLRFEEQDQRSLQVACALALSQPGKYDYDGLCALFEAAEQAGWVQDWRAFLPGLSYWLRVKTNEADPAVRLSALAAYPKQDQVHLAEAIAFWGFALQPRESSLCSELSANSRAQAWNPETAELWSPGWQRGLARRLAFYSALLEPRVAELLRSCALETAPEGMSLSESEAGRLRELYEEVRFQP